MLTYVYIFVYTGIPGIHLYVFDIGDMIGDVFGIYGCYTGDIFEISHGDIWGYIFGYIVRHGGYTLYIIVYICLDIGDGCDWVMWWTYAGYIGRYCEISVDTLGRYFGYNVYIMGIYW